MVRTKARKSPRRSRREREIARATGETLRTVCSHGFRIVDPRKH